MRFLLLFILAAFTFACSYDEGNGDASAEDAQNEEQQAQQEEPAPEPQTPNIVELAMSNDNLSTLVAAVKAGELVETLSGEGPFTVFAPTNDAFAALPEGTLDNLLKPENKSQLVNILTYHVVPGKVMSTDLYDDMIATTVQGGELTVSVGDAVMVNDATVVQADVDASNGVVHVVDKVILPAE